MKKAKAYVMDTLYSLAFTTIVATVSTHAQVPDSEVALIASVYDGIPRLGMITGYEMNTAVPPGWAPQNVEIPLYAPYDRDQQRWWDNLVQELIQTRVHVVMLHGRGCYNPTSALDGNGNMCPG